jgi:DNA-binding response OmpR family regulator
VVLAEDNTGDVFLVKEAIAAAGLDVDLYALSDGEEVLQFLAQTEEDGIRCPELLLLDLNLPRANGFEILAYIRGAGRCKGMRIIVMTSSFARSDRERSASFDIDLYFHKPASFDEFLTIGEAIRKLI